MKNKENATLKCNQLMRRHMNQIKLYIPVTEKSIFFIIAVNMSLHRVNHVKVTLWLQTANLHIILCQKYNKTRRHKKWKIIGCDLEEKFAKSVSLSLFHIKYPGIEMVSAISWVCNLAFIPTLFCQVCGCVLNSVLYFSGLLLNSAFGPNV